MIICFHLLDILGYEAAKLVSEISMSNDASNSSKIFVTCMMIDLFVTKSLKDDFAHDPHTQYDLIVLIFRGGIIAININVETGTETIDDYNKMWEKLVEFFCLVFSNKGASRKYIIRLI